MIVHEADSTLVNCSGRLVVHCIVDCLPRDMYSRALGTHRSLTVCKKHLLTYSASIRERLERASAAFKAVMPQLCITKEKTRRP